MKNVFFLALLIFQGSLLAQEECGFDFLNESLQADITHRNSWNQIESDIKNYLKSNQGSAREQTTMTIPIVFHKVWRDEDSDISDDEIVALLDEFNTALRAENESTEDIPEEFSPFLADTGIEFCFAQRDPDNNPTSGITTTVTTQEYFLINAETDQYGDSWLVKHDLNGKAPWDVNQYLNVWICNININSGAGIYGIKGYSSFPEDDPAYDGIVIHKQIGFDMQTLVHELGHYLSLYHIWGTETCGDDMVDDTPQHGEATAGCPIDSEFNYNTCNDVQTFEMYMNHMDYATCRSMFTHGQSDRMHAVLATTRASLLSSMGCLAPDECFPIYEIEVVNTTFDPLSIKVEWPYIAGSQEYYVEYKLSSADDIPSNWTAATAVDNQITLYDLLANEDYDFRVRPDCSEFFYQSIVKIDCAEAQPCDFCSEDVDVTIDNDQVLNISEISGDLLVTNGATLTINTKVALSQNSSVRVYPGSRLIVENNGILTKCPDADHWQGIVIEGIDNTVPGFALGGEVEIRTRGTVEHAMVGVYKTNQIISSVGVLNSVTNANVGRLTISDKGRILNSTVGVQLNSTGANLSFGPGQESSIIHDAEFIGNVTAMRLSGNHGLTVENSLFQDNEHGIHHTNSSIDVYDSNFIRSGFAMWINALYPNLVSSDIRRNAFIDDFSLFFETQNNAEILKFVDNTVVKAPMLAYGLSNFEITTNDILEYSYGYAGIESSATGVYIYNRILGNAFSNTYAGNNVDGINDIEYLSNCFENTEKADIGLGYGTTIDYNQGNEVDEAANCFDHGSRLVTVDTDTTLAFNYWKYPEGGGPPHAYCKEPRNTGVEVNYYVEDAFEQVNTECGSGAPIYGGYPFLPAYRDCAQFIKDHQYDLLALADLAAALQEEIDRLMAEVALFNINYWVAQRLINQYKECRDQIIKQYVVKVLEDSEGDDREEAIGFLRDADDFRYHTMAYGLMMDGSEYTRARVYLASLRPDREDKADFVETQQILLDHMEDPEGYVLNAADRSILYNAGSKRLPYAGFARAIYYHLTGEQIIPDVPMYDASPASRAVAEDSGHAPVRIYPNPSSGAENIMVEVLAEWRADSAYILSVYDLRGRLIMTKNIVEGKNNIGMDEANGVYYIKIENEGKIIHTDKIIRI